MTFTRQIIHINEETYEAVRTEKGYVYFGKEAAHEEWVKFFPQAVLHEGNEINSKIELQLQRYFAGEAIAFDLPFDFVGTPFQQAVWQALTEIPYGQTISYSGLAQKIGRPEATRAVANAVGRNPLMILVPCHRVLGKNGRLTGYRGGLPTKQRLLTLEGIAYKM
ncbi:methylated-DNA--[protein]-cysteine S-methyltransferase [Enterococcus sp.]|uniref:methylated-DNA--[protein]-cysteine S-methyltransferase n=1 Tax=Enterococcus sp. TaxID=35783 RepID=UPI0028977D34|nr:methylated-DNA--[protein]-cysteine S-methyltransferase [Enterococcus sp.]